MAGRLQGKVAMITGAGSVGAGWGNGRAAAVLFAQEGALVFGVDRNLASMEETAERIRELNGRFATAECDVTDAASVARAVEACRREFGRIDVLVNNVGGSAAGGPVELAEEVWDKQIAVNLKSVFLTCKHVLPVMEAQGGGTIVNVASTSGLRWTGSAQVAYAASKAGVIQLSRVVAVQYAARAFGSTRSCRARCTRRWSRSAWRGSGPAATSRRCSRRGWRASRSASRATDATPPMPCCSSLRTRRASSPEPRSSSTAA